MTDIGRNQQLHEQKRSFVTAKGGEWVFSHIPSHPTTCCSLVCVCGQVVGFRFQMSTLVISWHDELEDGFLIYCHWHFIQSILAMFKFHLIAEFSLISVKVIV